MRQPIKGRKILHNPSTLEIFRCLRSMPYYSKILAEHSSCKQYADFLHHLIAEDFFNAFKGKVTVKKISESLKVDTVKATKWIREIYEQVFELNDEKPELFQKNGIKVSLCISHYDNECAFNISFPVLPREHEIIYFPFVKAKVGTERFWVRSIQYDISENINTVTLWLEGGILNRYREFALEKALFQKRISYMDVYKKSTFELDEELKRMYRN